jgi:hypothetical protein
MRTITRLALAFSLFAVIGLTANAQDQTVMAGATHRYAVDSTDAGTSLSWNLAGGGALTPSATNGSASIVWGTAPGTYTLTMTETNSFNGVDCSTDNTFDIEVVSAGAVSFTATTSEGCADATDVDLSLAYTGTLYPIYVDYTIDGVAQAQLTINNAGELADVITIDGATYRTDPTGDDVANVTVSVVVTAAEGEFGGAIDVSTSTTHTHTAIDVPESNAIIAL